ncbi:MAG TPA: cupin domain-containing protein [Thermodesulfobacteriota bacterium]|nr:cupin domain-containing protein [Thermodesulfobacteriota bacterium]
MTLGERLKKIRSAKALSLENLAKNASLTRSFICQVEKDRASPSLSSLIKIAKALDVRIGDLFLEEKAPESHIIHEGERETYVIEKDKVKVELLAPRRNDIKFEPMLVHFGIGGTTDMISHVGVSFCMVLQGKLELRIGGEVYVLSKGDSIYLDSPTERVWKNIGETEVVSFAVGMPPINY